MKTILLILVMSLFLVPASGQFRFGFEGGANLATLILKNHTVSDARNLFRPGFNAGPAVNFPIGRHLSVQSALIFETKGTNARYRSDTLKLDGSTSLLYLDVPLLIRGDLRAGDLSLYVIAGPYAGIGLTGKKTVETADSKTTWDIKWGREVQDDFKRLDAGFTAGAGIEWNRFFFEGSFVFGLVNIYAADQTGYVIQHRVFSLKAGYFLR
jgi:hypothetical protein